MNKRRLDIILPLIIIVAILIKCVIPGDFSKVSGINPSQVIKVTVQTDWGENKVITSKTDIQSVIGVLDSAHYTQNALQEDYTGYLYCISFYEANNKTANITLGSYPIINGKKYMAFGIDTEKVKKIIDLYPPES